MFRLEGKNVALQGRRFLACALLASVLWQVASAADGDACTRFKWDVSRELAVMQQTPQALAAAARPGSSVPQITVGTLYSLRLADQGTVTFVAAPARASRGPGARAGLVRFRVKKAGRYRVSITSGHWVDVVDGMQLVPSVDFQGHVGCERPRKIVEFDLPAGHELTLQFSGSSDAEVIMAVTAVGAPAAS
jgi:hypothetical protein